MLPVMFFHGLNTYGDDLVHLGPWVMGKMHEPIRESFHRKGIEVVPVLPMGTGDFQHILDTAKKSLVSNPVFRESRRVHFLGHSMGALVARALLHDLKISEKVDSMVSFGAPHHGTKVVERVKLLPPTVVKVMKVAGWDLEAKMHMIEHLTRESMAEFNEEFPNLKSVKYASVICHSPPQDLTLPIKVLSKLARPGKKSDGIVKAKSQKHGEVLGQCSLDHICQIGFFPYVSRSRRDQQRAEFEVLLNKIADYWRNL